MPCPQEVSAGRANPAPMRTSRWTAAVTTLALLAAIAPPVRAAAQVPIPFTDVSTVSWAEPAIGLLAAQGVVKGVAQETFDPQAPVTGESMVTLLARLFPTTAGAAATPIPGVDAWAQASVAWARQTGIITDLSAFAPTAPAPRAEVVAWVVQALGLGGQTSSAPTFADAASIPPQFASAVGTARADGLVVGDSNGNFTPLAPVTRAETAVILLRAEEALALGAAPTQTPFNWSTGAASLLAGTAATGTDTLPVGAVTAARLSSTDGAFAADFADAAGIGAGTLVTTAAGQSTRTPFIWQDPTTSTPGGLWLFAGQSMLAYSFTATPAAVTVTAASALAASLGAGETMTLQPGEAASTETATATVSLGTSVGGATLNLTYSGPAIPPGPLIATETAAAAASVAP